MQIFRFAYFNKAPRQVTPLSHEFLLRGLVRHCFRAWRESCRFRGLRAQPGSRLPGTLLRLVALPDKKWCRNLAVPDLAAPVNQRRQSHRAQASERHPLKMRFAVSAPERNRENLFREPAVEQPELFFVVDVLQIVIDDGDVTHALFQRLSRNSDGKFRALSRIVNAREFGFLPPQSERKTLQIFRHLSREIRTAPLAQNSSPRCRMREAAAK